MKALRKLVPALAVVAALAMMAPAFGVAGQPIVLDNSPGEGRAGISQTGDIRHVANIGDDLGWSGSDIEFASREVVKLSEGATGDPVCQTDAEGTCLVDENGETVFQTEVRDFAIAGGYGQVAKIIDITDPENPVHVNSTPCNISQNDIQIHEDLLLVAADGNGTCKREDGTNAAFAGTAVLDFSDPRNPTYLSRLQYARGSHNHTFHPSGDYVYLSDSDVASAGLGNVPVWDVSDPANPSLVVEFKHLAHSPHDITFNADGSRAYVAAVSATYILNTEDPKAPELISTIANEGISISHQADPTPDGQFLLVTDELGGGAAGVSPGGPVHLYSLADETAPVKLGIIENNCVQEICHSVAADGTPISTAHVLRINPDGYTMSIAWYKDGIFVIDYSAMAVGGNAGPSGETTGLGPRVIAGMRMPGSNAWAAKMWQERHPGYVFVNDISRGFDIFHVPELTGGFIGTGAIAGGHPASVAAGGITEHTFSTVGGCAGRPATQGLDGYAITLPEGSGDGAHEIHVSVKTGQAADLALFFYDQSCSLMNTTAAGPDTQVPEGAAHVVINSFTGAGLRFNTYLHSH